MASITVEAKNAHGPRETLSLGVTVLLQRIVVRVSVVQQVQGGVVQVGAVCRDICSVDVHDRHVLRHETPELLQAWRGGGNRRVVTKRAGLQQSG